MKNLNISKGEAHISEPEHGRFIMIGNYCLMKIGHGEHVEDNTELIIDAFNVANEYTYTPSMLIKEREELLNNAKHMDEAMIEIIGSDYKLSEIVSQRKVFFQYLKEAREKLAAHITDPLTNQLDEKSNDYDFIKLLDTLID